MSRLFAWMIAAAVSCITAGLLAQAGVPAHYDVMRVTTIKGVFAGLAFPPGPRSYLTIDVPDGKGGSEPWVLEGNDFGTLLGGGWRPKQPAPFGSPVSATAYRPKAGVDLTATLPADVSPGVLAAARAGRLLHGIDVTFGSGAALPYGPAK